MKGNVTPNRKDVLERGVRRAHGIRNVVIASGITLIMMLSLFSSVAPTAAAAGPCDETAYANGQQFCIHTTKLTTTPSAGLLKAAQEVYVTAYFPLPPGCDTSDPSSCTPETLPSGYQPLCNPCFHGDGLNAFPYHDHVLEGAPGFGKDGTAGAMTGPWVVIVMVYNPSVSNAPGFTPIKSAAGLDAGEQAGVFLPINPGAANPYEVNTGVVLVFGVQPLA